MRSSLNRGGLSILLRDITVARIFWLSQSEERKNSAKPKKMAIYDQKCKLSKRTNRQISLALLLHHSQMYLKLVTT
jgi:hypothetical protein